MLTKYSPFTKCSAECGLGEKIRVRIPQPPQKKDEDLKRIIKLYNKLASKRSRVSSDEDQDEDEDDDGMGDFNVREISDPEHPCYEKDLINREICGERNRPCENDIYGMPRS